eukprot:TRINITY_DN5768_c1_g1_i1.p1 TRINITY_DN5768_c1_g1~~TRINITY_DN5768_c1_g1_i1.p1  ORF type:complete len:1349 (+),score=674.31 TRINITY_DN5768_c1_g1_i1:45-4049(+)
MLRGCTTRSGAFFKAAKSPLRNLSTLNINKLKPLEHHSETHGTADFEWIRGSNRTLFLTNSQEQNVLNQKRASSLLTELERTTEFQTTCSSTVITNSSPPSFSIGTSFRELLELKEKGDYESAAQYLADLTCASYTLNEYDNQTITIPNGFTLGSAVSLSLSSVATVATENSVFAFPESELAFSPHAGASYYLASLSDGLGYYLALTGNPLRSYNIKEAGLASHFVENEAIPSLLSDLGRLRSSSEPSRVANILTVSESETGPFVLFPNIASIKRCFEGKASVAEIFSALAAEEGPWAAATLKKLQSLSPLALCAIHELLNKAKGKLFSTTLEQEYRLANNLLNTQDFQEAVKVKVLRQGNTKIKWQHESVDKVTAEEIQNLFEQKPIFPAFHLPSSSYACNTTFDDVFEKAFILDPFSSMEVLNAVAPKEYAYVDANGNFDVTTIGDLTCDPAETNNIASHVVGDVRVTEIEAKAFGFDDTENLTSPTMQNYALRHHRLSTRSLENAVYKAQANDPFLMKQYRDLKELTDKRLSTDVEAQFADHLLLMRERLAQRVLEKLNPEIALLLSGDESLSFNEKWLALKTSRFLPSLSQDERNAFINLADLCYRLVVSEVPLEVRSYPFIRFLRHLALEQASVDSSIYEKDYPLIDPTLPPLSLKETFEIIQRAHDFLKIVTTLRANQHPADIFGRNFPGEPYDYAFERSEAARIYTFEVDDPTDYYDAGPDILKNPAQQVLYDTMPLAKPTPFSKFRKDINYVHKHELSELTSEMGITSQSTANLMDFVPWSSAFVPPKGPFKDNKVVEADLEADDVLKGDEYPEQDYDPSLANDINNQDKPAQVADANNAVDAAAAAAAKEVKKNQDDEEDEEEDDDLDEDEEEDYEDTTDNLDSMVAHDIRFQPEFEDGSIQNHIEGPEIISPPTDYDLGTHDQIDASAFVEREAEAGSSPAEGKYKLSPEKTAQLEKLERALALRRKYDNLMEIAKDMELRTAAIVLAEANQEAEEDGETLEDYLSQLSEEIGHTDVDDPFNLDGDGDDKPARTGSSSNKSSERSSEKRATKKRNNNDNNDNYEDEDEGEEKNKGNKQATQNFRTLSQKQNENDLVPEQEDYQVPDSFDEEAFLARLEGLPFEFDEILRKLGPYHVSKLLEEAGFPSEYTAEHVREVAEASGHVVPISNPFFKFCLAVHESNTLNAKDIADSSLGSLFPDQFGSKISDLYHSALSDIQLSNTEEEGSEQQDATAQTAVAQASQSNVDQNQGIPEVKAADLFTKFTQDSRKPTPEELALVFSKWSPAPSEFTEMRQQIENFERVKTFELKRSLPSMWRDDDLYSS